MRLSDTLNDTELWLRCRLILADYHLQTGNLSDSRSYLDACRECLNDNQMDSWARSFFARLEVSLARRNDRITTELIQVSLKLVRSSGAMFDELRILEEAAGWYQDCGAHEEALTAFNELIALTNTTSERDSVSLYQARRAQSVIALGRTEEAWPIILQFEKHRNKPNSFSARHYLTLGDHQKAREHALDAYKDLWGDGPPFQDHWALEDCREVLRALNEAEPELPPFDPSKIEPFDFEADVERLIENQIRKKQEKDDTKNSEDLS